jgi:rSAM/selenodomain-associated transferase 1
MIPATRILAHAPVDAGSYFREVAGEPFAVVPQSPGDLGQRMAAFFQSQLDAGSSATVLIGTDSPTLPLAWVEQAFAALAHADVVLGPATDGGYFLIGIARRLPPIFTGVRWSSAHVLTETVKLLPADWRLELLPPWYDVDTLADWQVLCGHLAALRRAGIDPGTPHTLRLCEEWTAMASGG